MKAPTHRRFRSAVVLVTRPGKPPLLRVCVADLMAPEPKPSGADSVGDTKKQTLLQKFVTRACMGAVMFSVFCAIIWAGHLYVCGFVVLLQAY